jgi:hypothetical protein
VLADNAAKPAPRPDAETAAVLVLYAAAHLTVETTPSLAPSLVTWADDLANKALGEVARLALAWIAEQFPSKIFPATVEELIRNTSLLAYA